jgi:hypothetical protein
MVNNWVAFFKAKYKLLSESGLSHDEIMRRLETSLEKQRISHGKWLLSKDKMEHRALISGLDSFINSVKGGKVAC